MVAAAQLATRMMTTLTMSMSVVLSSLAAAGDAGGSLSLVHELAPPHPGLSLSPSRQLAVMTRWSLAPLAPLPLPLAAAGALPAALQFRAADLQALPQWFQLVPVAPVLLPAECGSPCRRAQRLLPQPLLPRQPQRTLLT